MNYILVVAYSLQQVASVFTQVLSAVNVEAKPSHKISSYQR